MWVYYLYNQYDTSTSVKCHNNKNNYGIPWIYELYLKYYYKDYNPNNIFYIDSISEKYIETVQTDNTRDTFLFGKHHSIYDQPASISYINGMKVEKWYRFGQLYRDNNLPYTIITEPDNSKEYIFQDRIVTIYPNGNIKSITWTDKEGIENRPDNKYTYTSYYENGMIKSQKKRVNGELMSVNDEPAVIKYSSKSIKKYWYFSGKLHRTKYPAVIIETKKYKLYSWYYLGNKKSPGTIKIFEQ